MEVTIQVLTLKPKLFNQLLAITDYDKIRPILSGQEGKVLGFLFINHKYWLVVELGDLSYAKFQCHPESTRKYRQIFLS